jgi:hypothetical protein
MHIDRRLLGWGVFLVLLGGIPLAVRQGVLPAEPVARAWTLWPLFLVAIGLSLMLRATRFEALGTLLTATTAGVIAGGLLASGFVPFGTCGDRNGDSANNAVAFGPQQGTLEASADADITLNCGDLTIAVAEGSAWSVDGVGPKGGPRIDAAPGHLTIESRNASGFDFLDARSRWTVKLPASSTVDLTTQVNAGTARIDLGTAKLGNVNVGANAGQLTLDLSRVAAITGLDVTLNAVGDSRISLPAVSVRGVIHANAASVDLCAPAGVGLRLTPNDNPTSSNNYREQGLVRNGDAWETPGYATAQAKVDIETTVNAGSFNLEQEGSCGG